ncbi:MAG: hypothetical protein H3C34_15415 [Caldilineaceae bacterium]|nr:hypothetical protein [Caldilineaceae bacterium]
MHSFARAIHTRLTSCVRDEFLDASPFDRAKMPQLEKKIQSALPSEDVRKLLRVFAR